MFDPIISREDLILGLAEAISPSPFNGLTAMPEKLRGIMETTAIREATRCMNYLERVGFRSAAIAMDTPQMMGTARVLDFKAVESLVGEEAANTMFCRAMPAGMDLENPGDLLWVTRAAEEREASGERAGAGDGNKEFDSREHGEGCAYFLHRSVGISAGWYPKEQRDR